MPGIEVQYEVFDCPRIGGEVTITRETSTHRIFGTDDMESSVTTSLDCDHKSWCGVGSMSGKTRVYDWNECAHPVLKAMGITSPES